MSVPNQCLAEGRANCSSLTRLGGCVGKRSMASTSAARTASPDTAALFRRNRRTARWFGLRCSGSLILHSRVEERVGEVDEQIQTQQEHRVEQGEAHGHCVIAV